jgi:hypothetical protein
MRNSGAHLIQEEAAEAAERFAASVSTQGKENMTEADPIRVYCRNGEWVVDYGSYAQGHYGTRGDAVKAGTDAARQECRKLTVEPPLSA